MTVEAQSMEQRIHSLERQNRNFKRLIAGALVLGVASLILGQAASSGGDVAHLIRAHRIEIVSPEGRPAVVLGMTSAGTGTVTTMDAEGNKTVTLGVTRGGEGTITTYNGKGNELIKLAVTTQGEGVVITNNGDGRKLVEVGVTIDGDPKIFTFKPDGSTRNQWP